MTATRAELRRPSRFGRLEWALLAITLAASAAATSADYEAIETRLGLMKTQANWSRYWTARASERSREPDTPWLARQSLRIRAALNHVAAALIVATIGAGLTAFARRSNRTRWCRGAGEIALAGLTPWLALAVLNEFLARRFPRASYGYEGTFHIWNEIAEPIGGAVLALWLLLRLGRSWRAEPTATDRLGRALGILWITYASADAFFLPWISG